MTDFFQQRGLLVFLAIFSFQKISFSQKTDIVVDRCGAVSRSQPVKNIWVDADQNKWVGTKNSVFKVNGCELATEIPLAAGEHSVLQFFGGNTDFRWTDESLRLASGETDLDIVSAWFDAPTSTLWLGTKTKGMFRLATNPSLKLLDNQTSSNSKLKSNFISSIFKDNSNKFWVGTPEGAMVGKSGDWSTELSGYAVQRFRQVGGDVFALADGEFWRVVGGKKFTAIDIDFGALEGEPDDFDVAPDGKLWILSRIVSRYDMENDEFQEFSAPEDYTSEFGRVISADGFGSIWVGTDDKGVYLFEKGNGISVAAEIEKKLSCNGNGRDAAILVKVDGGKKPYEFRWSVSSLVGENPKNLPSGDYIVTVTDANGKAKTAKTKILEAKMTLNLEVKKSESPGGKSDGVAEAKIEGGQSPFKFSWDNGETGISAVKLNEGKHKLTVTDAAGCTAVAEIEVTQKVLPLNVSLELTNEIKCRGDQTEVVLTATGGKLPLRYDWNNPNWKGEKPSGITAGEARVTVTDATGASKTAVLFIKEPAAIGVNVTNISSATSGQANGKVKAKANGGTGAYIFAWDSGETGETASKLSAGEHTVTVTDANGCSASIGFPVAENILPLAVSISETSKIKCFGDETGLLAEVSGGKPPYKFAWSEAIFKNEKPQNVPAGAFSVTVTDAVGSTTAANFSVKSPEILSVSAIVQSNTAVGLSTGKAKATPRGGTGNFEFSWDNGESEATATNLSPGKHSVTVSDENGCTASASIEISENILPLAFSIAETSKIKCFGGKTSLSVDVSGGKPPFSYVWSENSLKNEKPSGVPAGTFSLTVTDATGKTTTGNIQISEPAALSATAVVEMSAGVGLQNGKARATARGGSGKISFVWDDGETTETATKLAAGNHSVTATDVNGCTATANLAVSENVLPVGLTVSQTFPIKCFGEKTNVKVEVTGGKPPFNFSWSDPKLTGDSPEISISGNYEVTVSDGSGTKQSAKINVLAPEKLTVELVRKFGATTDRTRDGSATVQVSGGLGSRNIVWDNSETGDHATKLTLGNHKLTVTDANGCTANFEVEIGKRALPDLDAKTLKSGSTVRMESLRFEADSTSILPENYELLTEVFNFLAENGDIVVEIGGHTNNVPPDDFCDRLSTARAKAVANYMVSKGIDPKRVVAKGYGKRQPYTTNSTPLGRQKNQRVEIKILQIGG